MTANPDLEQMTDKQAMHWADAFVGVMPFGRSASLEMGWAAGAGKLTLLLLADGEPELMVKMLGHICVDLDEVLDALACYAVSDEREAVDAHPGADGTGRDNP